MERVKTILHAIFYRYCIVFTLIIGANMIGMLLLHKTAEIASFTDLALIQLMAALCALGEIICFVGGELSKRKEFLRYAIHYLYINIIVFSLILTRTSIGFDNGFIILVTIAVIYWINFATDFYRNKKDALKMTDLLQKINNNDE